MTWLTPDEVARLEEARIAQAIAEVALEAIEVAGGTVCWGGAGSWMNEGRGIGVGEPVSRDDVDRAVRFLRDHDERPRFDVCPYADPALLPFLGDHGLRALAFETVLYRTLEDVEPPTDADIVRVDDADAEAFVEGVTRWFADDERPPTEAERWSMRQVLSHPRVEAFFVRIDGRPVGGGAVELGPETGGDRVAALIMTSVDPRYRRRGVQRALMLHRLRRARELGATVATIGSDPSIATGRNALRLGFRVAYTKLSVGEP